VPVSIQFANIKSKKLYVNSFIKIFYVNIRGN